MSRRRTSVALAAAAGVLAVALPAAAYWGFSPSGSTTYTAASLANPATVAVSLTAPSTASVSWTAPANPSGTAYRVTRTTDGQVVCPAATTSCAAPALPGIANTYAVAAVLGQHWVAKAAAPSAAVTAAAVFAVTPSTATPVAGTAFTVQVRAQKWDVATGALVTDTGFGSTALAFSGPANAPIGTAPTYPTGTTTFSSGVTGNVSVTLRRAETVQLAVTAGSGVTQVRGSVGLTVGAGAPSRLAFATSPGGAVVATAFGTQPVVTVLDALGNPTAATDSITLAIGTNPAGGALTCTSGNSRAAVAGSASFAGCRIDKGGTGYTLTASATGRTGATSAAFDVGAAFAITSPASGATNVGRKPTITGVGADPNGGQVTLTFTSTTTETVEKQASVNPNGGWQYSSNPTYLDSGTHTYLVTATQGDKTSTITIRTT